MKTIAELQAFDKQREAINDELADFGRKYGEKHGRPIPENAFFESWEIYHSGNIILSYEETWQGGSERYTLVIAREHYEKQDQTA